MLNYKTYGSGKPIIIMHGLFGMLDNWRSFARLLEDEYKIILVDQRNHGKSFWSDSFDYNLLAEDLHALIHELGIEKPVLMGHSMGGKTAIQCAYQYPNQLAKLVVVDIAPKAYPRGHDEIFKAIFNIELAKIELRKTADEELSKYISDFAVRQFLLKNLSRRSEGGFEWKANFQSLYDNYDIIRGMVDLSRGLSTPTLFVKGKRSNYISEVDENGIREIFRDVQIAELDTGHWIHAEQPKELAALLRTFLTA